MTAFARGDGATADTQAINLQEREDSYIGYSTDFIGKLAFNKPLAEEDREFLKKFSETRRMARNVDEKYGEEGEFYVEGEDGDWGHGQGRESNIIDYNRPPKTQPSLWCQWIPSEDGKYLEWDGGEKFYNYVEWLMYIIANITAPRGYILSGVIEWQGEDEEDTGRIIVENNNVTVE